MRRGPLSGASPRFEPVCKPDSVSCPVGQSTVIHLGEPLPVCSSGLPETIRRATGSLLGLAPGGVYRAAAVAGDAGGLLHHRFTLACSTRPKSSVIGGLLSAALSVGLPRLEVIQHPALWSPDFPRRAASAARRDRPTGSLPILARRDLAPTCPPTGEPRNHNGQKGLPDNDQSRRRAAPEPGDGDNDESQEQTRDHPMESL